MTEFSDSKDFIVIDEIGDNIENDLENDWLQNSRDKKEHFECKLCHKLFFPEQLKIHMTNIHNGIH